MIDKVDLSKGEASVSEAVKKIDFTAILEKYRDPATVYAWLVVNDKIVSGEMMKLACFRHLQDLRRAEDPDEDFPYRYDLGRCRSILGFASIFPEPAHGKPMPLMLWQKAILCMSKAWVYKDNDNFRYTRVIVSVARANGKSYIASIMLWYTYLIECAGLSNQDIGYTMPTGAQMKKPWAYVLTSGRILKDTEDDIQDIFSDTDTYIGEMGVKSAIGNKVVQLSNESGQFDSYHFRLAVVDEAGDGGYAHKPNIGKITQGQSHLPNAQLLMISTSYENTETLFYKDQIRLKDVMKKDYSRDEDSYLCLVWQQDNLDEINQPETWIKSNPLLELDEDGAILKRMISDKDAHIASGIANEFQNRNLNNWLQVKVNSYVSLEDLEKAVIPSFSIDNRQVYIGYDKGQFSDDNAIAFVYPYEDNGVGKFHVEQFSFIPLRNSNNDINIKEHQDGINYRAEVEKGFGKITENQYGIVEDDEVCNWLLNYVDEHHLQVKAFLYDFYHETSMTKRLVENTEWVCVPVHQGVRSLNEPTRFFRDELHQGRITMLDDGILQYSLKNALLFEENNGIKINKDKRTSKIDAVDALIDALYEAMYYFDGLTNVKTKSIWDNKTTDEINDYFMNDFSF